MNAIKQPPVICQNCHRIVALTDDSKPLPPNTKKQRKAYDPADLILGILIIGTCVTMFGLLWGLGEAAAASILGAG